LQLKKKIASEQCKNWYKFKYYAMHEVPTTKMNPCRDIIYMDPLVGLLIYLIYVNIFRLYRIIYEPPTEGIMYHIMNSNEGASPL